MLFRKNKGAQADDKGGATDRLVKRDRNRMAGLWAAELLGLIGHAAQDYARELAHAHEQHHDDEPVVKKLADDLKGRASVHEIREKLAHLLHEARRQLRREKDDGGGDHSP